MQCWSRVIINGIQVVIIKQGMNQTKKINARTQKWRTMLTTGIFKDPQLLQSRVRKGIPQSIRIIAWPQLARLKKHIEQRSVDINYQKLINSLSNNVYQISLDIPRTFPEEEDSKVLRKSMNNVLKAIAIVHPKIGYCQGMNFLALRILEILDDQQCFWLLDYLFQTDRYLKNNFIDPQHINLHHHNFQILLNEYLPGLLKTITDKGIYIQAYTMKCFMTIFSAVLRQQFFNRIFEVYLLQGWSIIYAVAIVLFKRHEKQFKSLSMEQIHLLLGRKVFDIANIDDTMNQAYKLNIKNQRITQLEKMYLTKVRQSQKNSNGAFSSQILRREKANQAPYKFTPQSQNIGLLTFQNKAEEVNFDSLYILKNRQ